MDADEPNMVSKEPVFSGKLADRERELLEAGMDGVIAADRAGTVMYVNRQFSVLTGHKRRNVAGMPVSALFVEEGGFDELLRTALGAHAVREGYFSVRSLRDGVLVRACITAVTFVDGSNGAVIHLRDMSGQRLIEEQTAHLAAIVTSSNDAIISQSAEGIISVWNSSAEKIFGYPAVEAIGQHVTLVIPAELVDEEQDVIDRIWRGEQVDRYETLRKRKDGRIINVSVAVSAIRDNRGNITGISKIEREITDQKKFEKELLEAKRNAERGKHAAEEATRVKQHFLATMSHEIRTPLNAIIGFTRLLMRSNVDEKQREYLDAIAISGEALMNLVNDILDLGKVQAGKMTFDKLPFDPRALVDATLKQFEPTVLKRKLALFTHFDDALPRVLAGDPSRLRQVLLNLVGNAVKFTREGRISVNVSVERTTPTHTVLRFSVSDTGIGIAQNEQTNIFDNFTQAGGSAARIYGGTGLGLAIVKQLVTAQGGEVFVKSRQGEGSEFWFTLEFANTDELPAIHYDAAEAEQDKTGIRVLLADDMTLNQIFMRTLLNSFGCDVDIAGNGKIAVEKLRQNQYDLVLMDLQMPEMNGYEATRILRSELGLKIPVIALTADVTASDVERCREVGMDDYIPKPVDDKLLHQKIRKFCREKPARSVTAVASRNSGPGAITNLDYLRRFTFDDNGRMKQLLSSYIDEIPRLINRMKQSINNMDWQMLSDTAHAIIPSFQIVGINPGYEEMARKIREHATRKEESILINDLVTELEAVCIQVVRELKTELARL